MPPLSDTGDPAFAGDHFSQQASVYARARPGYPRALYAWLAGVAPARRLALDVGCGSGQATRGLAPWFARVVGTDASAAQLREAWGPANVAFVRGAGEACPVASDRCDLLTAAQAAHWLDHRRFHAEAERVLVAGGVLAVWTYTLVRLGAPVDALLDEFCHRTVGADWPPERRFVDRGYEDLPFPWPGLRPPELVLERSILPADLLAYLQSWSSVQRHRARTGTDPLPAFAAALHEAWGEGPRRARWRLRVRAGRKP